MKANTKFNRLITRHGITRKFVSKATGISYSHLTNWIEGRVNLGPQSAYKIELFTDGLVTMREICVPDWQEISKAIRAWNE